MRINETAKTLFEDEKVEGEAPEKEETSAEGGLELNDLEGETADKTAEPGEAMPEGTELGAVYDVPVQISAVLGKSSMQVSQLLKMGRGAVVELDRKVGEAIDIYVNNRLVARGEVVVVGENIGVTMTEIIKSDRAA